MNVSEALKTNASMLKDMDGRLEEVRKMIRAAIWINEHNKLPKDIMKD